MTRRPAHTEREAMTFWRVFEAKHGLRQPAPRQPPMTDTNGNTAEPLPTSDPEQE